MHVGNLDVFDDPPRPVATRFELAALRLADAWLTAGRLQVSSEDLQLAREFLARDGLVLEQDVGLVVRLHRGDGAAVEMTREDAVLLAIRRLAGACTRARARDGERAVAARVTASAA